MKKTQPQNDADIREVYKKLGLDKIADIPYNKDEQMGKFQKFSLFNDNNHYYASGDTRTDR